MYYNGVGYGYPQQCVPVMPVAVGYGGGGYGGGGYGGGCGGCLCAFIIVLFILIILCGCGGCCGFG